MLAVVSASLLYFFFSLLSLTLYALDQEISDFLSTKCRTWLHATNAHGQINSFTYFSVSVNYLKNYSVWKWTKHGAAQLLFCSLFLLPFIANAELNGGQLWCEQSLTLSSAFFVLCAPCCCVSFDFVFNDRSTWLCAMRMQNTINFRFSRTNLLTNDFNCSIF